MENLLQTPKFGFQYRMDRFADVYREGVKSMVTSFICCAFRNFAVDDVSSTSIWLRTNVGQSIDIFYYIMYINKCNK